MTTRLVRCPNNPDSKGVNGCGHEFLATLDDEGWADCPQCGLGFAPNDPHNQPQPEVTMNIWQKAPIVIDTVSKRQDWMPTASDYDGTPVEEIKVIIEPLSLFTNTSAFSNKPTYTITKYEYVPGEDVVMVHGRVITKAGALAKNDTYDHFLGRAMLDEVPVEVRQPWFDADFDGEEVTG